MPDPALVKSVVAPQPLIVFAHVFHVDIWEEIVAALDEALDRPFALVVTCHDPELQLARPSSAHLTSWTRLDTANRGRDVLPFLIALRAAGQDFQIGLKLHTKRSPHRKDGEAWRRFLVTSLLRRDERRLVAPDLMERVPAVGLIAPDYHLMPLTNRMVFNRGNLEAIMAATDCAVSFAELETKSFCAGTMFWFRRAAIAPFFQNLLDPLFVNENAQLDGTAAHAAERLFAYVIESQGYVATAGEAVDALRSTSRTTSESLRSLSSKLIRPGDNPFLTGFRPFWNRHPRLFEAYAILRHVTIEKIFEIERIKNRRNRA